MQHTIVDRLNLFSRVADGDNPDQQRPIVAVVIPCLNEATTLLGCIEEAFRGIAAAGVCGEVVVADNGSTDGSQEVARLAGARVVDVPRRGYGAAVHAGILAANAEFVVMGDADLSYNFTHIPRFLARLQAGDDLVMGNRFRGGIEDGAMPWLHRFLGNPVLSFLGRLFYRSPVGDFHCGMRGMRRSAIVRLGLNSPGMEYASEMIVRASIHGLRISEVPTVLRCDERTRPPHLRTWRDGWRHLKYLLLHAPNWLFLGPGLCLFSIGMVLLLLSSLGSVNIGGARLGPNTMLAAACIGLLGFQVLIFYVLAKSATEMFGVVPPTGWSRLLQKRHGMEMLLLSGGGLVCFGIVAWGVKFYDWSRAGFGALDPISSLQSSVPILFVFCIGMMIVFASFLLFLLFRIANDR